MADVLRTGSVVRIDQTANSGSQSITVPSDANCIVIGVTGFVTGGITTAFFSNASITLGGTSVPYRIAAETGDDISGLYVLASDTLPVGSQTLAWDFEGTNTFGDGGGLDIAFYKNVDTTSPIRDSNIATVASGVSTATATTPTLTAESGDAIVCSLYAWDSTNPSSITWTNATSIAGAVYNNSWYSLAEGFPTGNAAVTADPVGTIGDQLYLCLSAVVLAHSTAPQVEPTGTPVHIDTTSASSSQSITVPSDATLMVVAGGGYFGNVSIANPVFTLASTNCVRQVGGSPGGDFDAGVVETYVNPPTGSQTLAWTFPTIGGGSVKIEVVFYKNVNTAAPVSDTGRIDHNTITSGTETITGLTAPTGSMTFGASWSDSLPDVSGNGQTSIAQSANTSVRGAWGQKRESTSFEATNQVYSMLLAIVIDPLTATPQYAYPVADTVIDNWETLTGGTSNLYQQIDETSASDTDGVRSQLSPSNDVYTCELGALVDPAVNTGHTFDFRYGKDAAGGDVISLLLQLRYGYTNESSQGTLIATLLNSSNIPDGWNDGTYTLSGTEADNIPSADYGNGLYVRAVANKESSGYVRPTYVGGKSGTGTTSSYTVSLTSLTGGSDSSPQTGDVIVVYHSCGGTTDQNMTCSGDNSGTFTEVGDWFSDDTRDVNLGVFIQVVGATPDTQITVNGAPTNYAAATVLHVWRGVDTTTPQDVTATVDATTTNSGRPITPAITPTTDKAVIISGGAGSGANTMSAALTTPTGTSIGQGVSVKADGSSADVTVGMFAYTGWDSGEGAYDPPNYSGGGSTSTSDARRGVTLALRPAAAPRRAQISWERFQVPAAPSGDVTVTCTAGTATASAQDAGIDLAITLAANTGTATASGSTAGVGLNSNIAAAVGTATASGSAATLTFNQTVSSAIGTATANGAAATIALNQTVAGAVGTATASGSTATISLNQTVSATTGTATANGSAASIFADTLISATVGTATASGQTASVSLINDVTIAANVGTATASGATASVSTDQTIAAAVGTATAAGAAASIAFNVTVAAGIGTATASGATAGITSDQTVPATTGTATAQGQTASISLTTGVDIFGTVGTATASGLQAGIDLAVTVAATPATATAAGATATVDLATTLPATSATATAAGAKASIDLAVTVAATPATATASGSGAVIVYFVAGHPTYEQRMGIAMLEQNKADSLTVFMRDATDHMTGIAGATLTIKLSKANSAFSVVSRTVTEIGSGAYRVALQAGDTDTPGDLLVLASATGCDDSLVVARVLPDIDADVSMYEAIRILLSPLAGQAGNLGGTIETFYDTSGQKVRFTSTVDQAGNRTVTLSDLT